MEPVPIQLTSILIVEDDPAMQARLRGLMHEVAGAEADIRIAADLASAEIRLREQRPTLALVDVRLPDGSGIDLIQRMQQDSPETQAVIVSAFAEEETILAALRAGAIGYLLKDREDIELVLSLRSLQRGGAPIDPMIARRILAMVPAAAPTRAAEPADAMPIPQLSARECEMLQWVAQGLSNRDIAARMNLSRLTVEGYAKIIYRKLAVKSRTAAVYEARTLGLLE
ncbi:response regulator [Solilutibacter silvestris]|uniref:response regulator n=1 Tax=Solilutibacter silvestris TaxID=1645665 RepID=UPI00197BC9B5|nr:response regulator transcription factor [Lysobacter silvestris]